MTDPFVVDRSLVVLLLDEGRLSDRMLGAYNRLLSDIDFRNTPLRAYRLSIPLQLFRSIKSLPDGFVVD